MNYNNRQSKTTALTTIIVSAVVFCLFSFCWLYAFQGDMLMVAQHILSDGQTQYNRLVGAVLITVILLIVQHGVHVVVRLSRATYALTYFPSFVLLAMLSCLAPDDRGHMLMGYWMWLLPLLLIVWGGAVWLAKQMEPFENDARQPIGLFSRCMWVNMLLMCFMMLMVAVIGNTKAVYHYRVHAETALLQGNADEALRVAPRSKETDEHLTMLRLLALSQKHLIGDSLFSYAIAGSSADMLPLSGSKSRLLIYQHDSLWAHFGRVIPKAGTTVSQYLDSLAVDTLSTAAYRDYQLAGMLIDRNLGAFAELLPRYYPLKADSLPRYYREALMLYLQLDTTRVVPLYSDTVMAERWQQFAELRDAYDEPREQQQRIWERFRLSYWNYFFYSK